MQKNFGIKVMHLFRYMEYGVLLILKESLRRRFNLIMPENGVRYVISGDRRIYLKEGSITSVRKLKEKKE